MTFWVLWTLWMVLVLAVWCFLVCRYHEKLDQAAEWFYKFARKGK